MEKFFEKLNVKLFVLKDSIQFQVSKTLKYFLFLIHQKKIKISIQYWFFIQWNTEYNVQVLQYDSFGL